jgi:acetyl esterase/lipase
MSEQRRRFVYRESVPYGDDDAQVLDVWRAPSVDKPTPVLIFVPGGAWLHGSRRYQGHALLAHLAARGWLCLAIDYRVSPRHRWPRHIMDVKAAIAWARKNVQTFGGDPGFVAVAGASAGGHLASLAAFSPGDLVFDVELGGADSAVDAAVSLYGRYDWEDRSTSERDRFMGFLEHLIVKQSQQADPELFRAASPLARTGALAPPFLVVHGTADSIIPVGQARAFVDRLAADSRSPVCYLELPGAQHGFDLFDGARTDSACLLVGAFLDAMYRRHATSIAV